MKIQALQKSSCYIVEYKFLVVRDSGVVGTYNDLEEAKQALNAINTGNRFIAEVNADGSLDRDPHLVGGQNQGAGISAGFNKHWCDWPCINRLMDICEMFIKNGPPKTVSKTWIQKYSRDNIVTKLLII